MGGKTRNIAIQRVLQQCYKKSCTFFVARFPYPQFYEALVVLVDAASPRNISIDKKKMSSGTRGSEQPSFKRNQEIKSTEIFRRPLFLTINAVPW